MPKVKLSKSKKKYLKKLGSEIRRIILEDKKYSSLDRFALEHHDLITKPSLYAICNGERDFQISSIMNIAEALEIDLLDLLKIND